MNALLSFIAACAAIVTFGWIVSKITGSRAWFIEDGVFDPGETAIWRDDKADVLVVPRLGQAVIMQPMRLHRWPVVVTNRRILIAQKTFTGRRMVRYVLYPGTAPDGQSKRLGGGLLKRGYQTLVIQPGVATPHPNSRFQKPYVALAPVSAEASSFNIAEIRIYTDSLASFCLP